MAKYRSRLELNWVNKGDIIISKIFPNEEKARPLSYLNGDFSEEELLPRELELIETVKHKKSDPEPENMLIWGENLIALKSIEKDFAGRIKLIYIDPPFNTGADFEHYEDGLEHSIWLSIMENRLRLLEKFLTNDGVIFVHIDYRELANLKLLMEAIFNRNFLTLITLKAKAGAGVGQESFLFDICEYILGYAKNPSLVKNGIPMVREPISDNVTDTYNKILVSTGRERKVKTITGGIVGNIDVYKHIGYRVKILKTQNRTMANYYNYFASIFRTTNPQGGLMKRIMPQIPDDGLVSIEYIPSKGRSVGQRYRYYFLNGALIVWLRDTAIKDKNSKQVYKFVKNNNLWIENLHQGIANEGGVILKQGKKPEKLLKKLIEMTTQPNDWVLDCFGGSGTTGAVAHKLGRKWIMIEISKLAKTHCFKRLKDVVSGKDQTAISKEVGWRGSGGFKFYKLGEPLIVKHKNYPSIKIINPKYYNGALIKVICKLEGFIFKDDPVIHGVNKLGNKYAHITEQYISQAYVDYLYTHISENEELILYCFKRDEPINIPNNIVIKKLPNDLLKSYAINRKDEFIR